MLAMGETWNARDAPRTAGAVEANAVRIMDMVVVVEKGVIVEKFQVGRSR